MKDGIKKDNIRRNGSIMGGVIKTGHMTINALSSVSAPAPSRKKARP